MVVDGEVVKGTLNPTMTPAVDFVVKPQDESGETVPGSSVTLVCGDPPRSYSGKERDDGSHIFKDAIPETGREDCEITVEAPG